MVKQWVSTQPDRLDVSPAAEGQPELVDQVREGFAGDRYRKAAGVGEVGQPLPTWRMILTEDQFTLGAFGRPPVRNAPLQRAQELVGIAIRMAALQLFQNRGGAKARHGVEHRHELVAPDLDEGILPRSVASYRVLLAWEDSAPFEASPGSLAETGAGGRRWLGVSVFARVHVPPDLAVGDVLAGHSMFPPRSRGEH
jgi:hypothetical protein